MEVYISIFLIVFSFCFLRRKYQLWALFASCLFLWFFMGFRHEVGGDWLDYSLIHLAIYSSENIQAIFITDPAYGLLNYYFAGPDGIYYVNFVCAFFLAFGVYRICRQQPHPIASLLIFMCYTMFVTGMGYTRQSAGIGLSLIAFSFIVEKRFFWFFFFALLGITFHSSAVITLLFTVFFVDTKKILSKYLYIAIVLGLIFSGYLWQKISAKSAIYGVNSGFHSSGGTARHLMNAIPAVIFLWYQQYFKQKLPQFFTLLKVGSVFTLILFAISPAFSTLSDRIAQYLVFIQAMVYPAFIYKFRFQDRASVLMILITMYFIFLYYWFSNSFYAVNFWIPYKNFLLL